MDKDEKQEASLTWRVTPDMMCILDSQGCFVAVNPAWQQTLGWSREEMVGKPYLGFLHPDDVAPSMVAFEQVTSGHPVLRFENRYRTRDGDHRWFSWVAVPEDGRYCCTVRDVTDGKRHVETIAEQRAEAELREQFLAVLSHDLRNPLAAVGSGMHLLLRAGQDAGSSEIIRQMQSSVSRMSELIDNLMEFARVRLGSGIGLERTTTTTLARDLGRVIEEIKLAASEAAFEVNLDLGEPVTCDVPRICQLVSNLLANAVMHGQPSEPIQVDAHTREGRLTIAIANRGTPIAEEARTRLFQPFFRGQVRASQQGLGLGLYIAAEIARAHGGSLDAASTERETRFTLDIPLRGRTPCQSGCAASKGLRNGPSCCMLDPAPGKRGRVDGQAYPVPQRPPQIEPRRSRPDLRRPRQPLHGASGKSEFVGEQPVGAQPDRLRHAARDLQPLDRRTSFREHLPRHHDVVELLHAAGPAPEPGDVEREIAHQARIVGLQQEQEPRIEGGNLPTLHDGAVPRRVAHRAPIDEPGIDAPAVGVEPDPVAAAKASRAAAPAAVEPGVRGGAGNDRPLHAQGMGHAGLLFPLGSPAKRRKERGPERARRGRDEREADRKQPERQPQGPARSAMPNRSRIVAPTDSCVKTGGVAGASPHDRGTAETGAYLGKGTRLLSRAGACVAEGTGTGKDAADLAGFALQRFVAPRVLSVHAHRGPDGPQQAPYGWFPRN